MKTSALLRRAARNLDRAFKKELQDQGHSLTGKLEQSIQAKISETQAQGEMLDYGNIINDGTSTKKIPYGGNRGSSGGTSQYIQGLINFFKLRGLSDKEATGAAFATAKVQKKEGMSTKASSRFSKNGKRQQFIKDVMTVQEPILDKTISDGMDDIFNTYYNKQLTETI